MSSMRTDGPEPLSLASDWFFLSGPMRYLTVLHEDTPARMSCLQALLKIAPLDHISHPGVVWPTLGSGRQKPVQVLKVELRSQVLEAWPRKREDEL